MRELMNYIYNKLSFYASTTFEDLERDEQGVVTINDINIVYNLEGVYQLTDNEVRKDITLTIDIWSRKNQIFEVEDLVEQLDKEFNDEVYRSDTLIFMLKKSPKWSQNLRDEDKNIRRKRLNYVVKFYK